MPRPIKPPASPHRSLLRVKTRREALLLEEEARLAVRRRQRARQAAAEEAALERHRLVRLAEARHARGPAPLAPAASAVRGRIDASVEARQEAKWAALLGGAPVAT